MPKYRVYLQLLSTGYVDVEAENSDDAADKAFDSNSDIIPISDDDFPEVFDVELLEEE
jgi:hypothetical protein